MTKGITGGLLFLVVSCTAIINTYGLYCPACQDIQRAVYCDETIKCGPHSATKPSRVDPGANVVCSETCSSSDLCSVSLCGDQDFITPRGPICFSCGKLLHNSCNKFQICGRDEVCYQSLGSSSNTGDRLMDTGCNGKQVCETLKQLYVIGRRRSEDTRANYFNCCPDDLCNNYTEPVATTRPSLTVHHATPIPTCTDHSSADVCQVTARYVCIDRGKAANAGCLKHCGFCSTSTTSWATTTHASTVSHGCTDITDLAICRVAGPYVCNDRDKATNANCLHYCGYC